MDIRKIIKKIFMSFRFNLQKEGSNLLDHYEEPNATYFTGKWTKSNKIYIAEILDHDGSKEIQEKLKAPELVNVTIEGAKIVKYQIRIYDEKTDALIEERTTIYQKREGKE